MMWMFAPFQWIVSARKLNYQDVLGTLFVSEKHGDQELNFQDEHMGAVRKSR
jgi:hypothetical protein